MAYTKLEPKCSQPLELVLFLIIIDPINSIKCVSNPPLLVNLIFIYI